MRMKKEEEKIPIVAIKAQKDQKVKIQITRRPGNQEKQEFPCLIP